MLKKYFISLTLVSLFFLSTGSSYATIQMPVFSGRLGQSHFAAGSDYFTRGENNTQAVEITETDSNTQNSTGVKNTVRYNRATSSNLSIPGDCPVSYTDEMYMQKKAGLYDPYATDGESGVNESKTLYTDGLGRLHFFGKDSKVKY